VNPLLTVIALDIPFFFSGAVLTEIVFSYPGVGYLLYQAVQQEDYPLIQGLLLVITIAVLAANLVADIAYAYLDPRISQERES
jgi:peptide/nickel transport system permease protein